MKKVNTTPLSGTQELIPAYQREFDELKSAIEKTFTLNGYNHIDTPALDRIDILLAKAGGETEKQIYKAVKTNQSADDTKEALRFDQTVPLARYVVEHENDLIFPFKVFQIGRCYRGERAQKGRFREFTQCDLDVIGRGSLPIAYDADVVISLTNALLNCGLSYFTVHLSNRKLLTGLLESLNLTKKSAEIFAIVDRALKVSPEVTSETLAELEIPSESVVKITTFININGNLETVREKLQSFNINNETFALGLSELEETLSTLEALELPAIADMTIVRGLDYYTGLVFETFFDGHTELGSICSGGRYENLAGFYTDQILPGVGGSIGLSRLFDVLSDAPHDIISEVKPEPPLYAAIIPLSPEAKIAAYKFAQKLRTEGKSCDIILTDKKLGQKLAYAAEFVKYACVLGEDELKQGTFPLKNLRTGEVTIQ